MNFPVKHKKHIEDVWRIGPVADSRLGKIRLDKNERISPFPESFWQNALQEITQEIVQACPEVWPLYQRLSEMHGIPMNSFLLTAGSDAAIRHCFEAFINPGDRVFFPEPTFAMVPIYGALYQADMRAVCYNEDLELNMGYLLEGIDEQTGLVILANPNSPTGTYVPNDVIARILKKALQYDVPVLIDEAYYGFCPHTVFGFLKEYPNLIVTRSFSKITGLAGLRVGYAIGQPEVISLLTKFRPMYEVNAVGIAFACKILDQWDVALSYGNQTVEGREKFAEALKKRGFPVINTQTNFLHTDFGDLRERILLELNKNGILVRGMLSIPGYENYTRFSVGPWSEMAKVLPVIDHVSGRFS